ncbi:double zinc ribbon domain-containing protein [Halobacterium litoreum]|uniref:Zinc ribbon domain-containing protein n=1 Tax=Halobacterium litoreum TaxID=2039234 RepID=A0ABD5NGG0_9EURY|nr:zinc ribbon domain-containing protein [Halobacterium litoreum]UHH12831.1 zinc ribbon domain-containing protein [Halobacterium litoreum]
MSKITFRADDDLVAAVEDLDESKSEVMREALRAYLDEHGSSDVGGAESLDAVVAERVDELVDERLGSRRAPARDVNVNISVESAEGLRATEGRERESRPATDGRREPAGRGGEQACAQCGEAVSDDHVYCPNCGEKASRRVFCECGDEVRADWAFCPHCGRRTASANALDR